MFNINEIENKMKLYGYYANEELIYETFNSLYEFNDSQAKVGQDIFAICLEGPPGAGKTEYAKIYTNIANEYFDNNVVLVDYQCDATTGKTELYEDINISAAIRGDADHVNIPGKLIEAIKQVNNGHKVVLFIDEYDKAREETDAFLLQFLQSGKINSTQHGDLEIKEEYKGNLQVILCKNDMREALSGPLSRRIRIIRLDYMEPSIFHQVANRVLVENTQEPVDDGLLNLVSLMYQSAYDNKEVFDRLPSCSEMLIAINDANRLLIKANAPKHIIYNTLVKNMFKSLDDITTFEKGLTKKGNDKLKELINEMKINTSETEKIDINDIIMQRLFGDELTSLTQKAETLEKLIDQYKEKITEVEPETSKQKINLPGGTLISNDVTPEIISNFNDSDEYIKRGESIFDVSDNEWTKIGTISVDDFEHKWFFSTDLMKNLGFKSYENGILLVDNENSKMIVYARKTPDDIEYNILADSSVVPSTYFQKVFVFLESLAYCKRMHTGNEMMTLEVNCLIYNDEPLEYNDVVADNIYHEEYDIILGFKAETLINYRAYVENLKCNDLDKAIEASNNLIKKKTRKK